MQNNKKWTKPKNKSKSNKQRAKSNDYMDNDIKTAQGASMNEAKSKSMFNDVRWYVASEQILKDVARLPYNIPVGMPFNRDATFTVQDGVFNTHSYDDAIPGIMVSDVVPVLGDTEEGPSSAVNVAANSLFQLVRSKISGTRFYIPVDMMLYMGVMDSLYCTITYYTRLYATCFTYHQSNRYLARALVESQNVDFDDLANNLTQFRAGVNLRIAKVRALYLPSVLPIFLRHSWMFSHYFIEGDNEKDQIYFHNLAGYHVFEKDSNGWGRMTAYSLATGASRTVAQLLKILDDIIDPIYQDEDFNRISGDMLKTYEGKVFTLSEIPDIVTTKFAYSEEVLLQFKNAKYKWMPTKSDGTFYGDFFSYYQNNRGELKFAGSETTNKPAMYNFIKVDGSGTDTTFVGHISTVPSLKLAVEAVMNEWSKDTLLTSPHADVEAGENMVNTRLTLAMELADSSTDPYGFTYPVVHFGSEWPLAYRIYTYHRNKSTGVTSIFMQRFDRTLIVDTDTAAYIRTLFASILPIRSSFKYLPELTLIERRDVSGTINAWEAGRSILEVDNYTLVSPVTIDGMHKAAILGEYNIPDLALKS